MTELETKKLIAAMLAAYPGSKMTADSTAVYERMLADLDPAAANAAVASLIATRPWPSVPSVGEIRERAVALTAGEVRAGGEAWGSVLKAISRAGRNRTPGVDFDFRDPLVLEAVRALGWVQLCDSENQVADRARFVELYDALAAKSRRAAITENLPAVQRFRALQAAQEREPAALPPAGGEARTVGQVLRLVMQAGGEP